MMYNNTVCECFFSPRHVGVIDLNKDFTIVYLNNQKGQGNIEFYIQCGQDRVMQRICFKTNGNPYLIAGLEWLSRQLEGHSIDKAPAIDSQQLIKELDIPTPQYHLALRIVNIFKESLTLMNSKLAHL